MASDTIPAALATRRSPTARRRGLAITVPAGSGGTTSVGASRQGGTVPLQNSGGLHASLETFSAKVPARPAGGEPAPCATAITAPLALPLPTKRPWVLPPSGLAVFYGRPETPRLFHYFLPRLLAEGKQVLCLDGANRFDPLLIARLARQRGREVAEFNRRIRVARAFTCFQLT